MPKERDYKKEYQQRIEKGRRSGLSRSQAAGHAKKGEQPPSLLKQLFGEARAPRTREEENIVRGVSPQPTPPPSPPTPPSSTPAWRPPPSMPARPPGPDNPNRAGDDGLIDPNDAKEQYLQEQVQEFASTYEGAELDLTDKAIAFLDDPSYYGVMSEYWNSGGFTDEQITSFLTDIQNFAMWFDDDGLHIEFDYDWESDDGGYSGSGHASATL